MSAYVHKDSYEAPPIDEALLQFSFTTPLTWNITTPGRVYEAIREVYNGEPESQEQVSASFTTDDSSGTGANFALNRQDSRVIYRNEQRNRFVIAHPHYLTVGSNAPYDGWPSLRQRMTWVIERLEPVWGSPPVGSVSIRYINRILLPGGPVNTDDYFNIPVLTARGGSASFSSFVQRVESVLDSATKVRTTFASIPTELAGVHPFLLDIEVIENDEYSMMAALDHADRLKNIENEEFEFSITDAARKLFV